MRVGLIGCGAIGTTLARLLQEEPRVECILVWDRARQRVRRQMRGLAKLKPMETFEEMLAGVDIVVEAAAPAVVRSRGPKVLRAGKELVVMSVGALLDPTTLRALQRAAHKGGSQFHVPSGAVAGIDGLKAAAAGKLRSVELQTTKPFSGFAGVAAAAHLDPAGKDPVVLYDGPAAEAVQQFPQNINVAATLALAGLGAERTSVRIVADPATRRNRHRLTMKGDFGRMTINVENLPSPLNPKTSQLAALSAVATVRGLLGDARLGT